MTTEHENKHRTFLSWGPFLCDCTGHMTLKLVLTTVCFSSSTSPLFFNNLRMFFRFVPLGIILYTPSI